ncbi:MAG TPA: hypothetical protein VGZ25_03620 [Gemmataceae bacterium]|nr:hypothetical protein [Gemmataceae bacterium]
MAAQDLLRFYQHMALLLCVRLTKKLSRCMENQNHSQEQWRQDVAASELAPPKLLDIAIPYEEVLDTARQIAAHTRERILKIAYTDLSNAGRVDDV